MFHTAAYHSIKHMLSTRYVNLWGVHVCIASIKLVFGEFSKNYFSLLDMCIIFFFFISILKFTVKFQSFQMYLYNVASKNGIP